MSKHVIASIFVFCLSSLLSACGFHLQGEMKLAPKLHRMYLQTPDPYGQLAANLKQYLKMSGVLLAATPQEADTILVISQDYSSQHLLSVNSTQQTRQYNLKVTVIFSIDDAKGRTIVPSQALIESRVITIQSDQILGSSNEENLFYQQMRRSLSYAIMNRIASRDVTKLVNDAYAPAAEEKKPLPKQPRIKPHKQTHNNEADLLPT